MRNIQISNITAYGTGNFCSSITGIENAKIENIYLNNIRFMNRGGLVEGAFLPDPAMEGRRKGLSPAHCMGKSAKLWIVHQKCGEYHSK